ncbi:MAG: hypothetical protein A2Y10_00895 [Planctomycetes bacterium GWF2_41_51]|nr:MAG: hypothetical protein A2Y10_00895 [Planctomycetes bacterium GWF2_41_51]HBG28109.1 hypothetical protein [Phycisphaerales bacterium]
MPDKILIICILLFFIIADASPAFGLVSNPDPANGETNIMLNKVLNWVGTSEAISYDIYLGTNAAAVEAAEYLEGDLDADGQVDYNDLIVLTGNWLDIEDDHRINFDVYAPLAKNWMSKSSLFKKNTASASFDPDIQTRTTYYWRVDQVNEFGTEKGIVWSFTTADSNYSLIGKIMCGYQGWFNCPGDGTTRNWIHWSKNSSSFTPGNAHIDMWPDMSEMNADEKFEAASFIEGSNHHYVFSSHNRNTVLRHFEWMQQYGIDGIYLQRFGNEIKSRTSKSFYHRNDVLSYCKDGANISGRVYAVMYDLSGLDQGETSYVREDWKYLVDTKKITKDANDNAYMYHNGKPVVAVWGIGFNDGREYTLQECLDLVNFFKSDPIYGGCTVMVGVPSYWRTLDNTRDCLDDPMVHTIILAADIVSPWSIGRYANSIEISTYTNNVWAPDVTWCNNHNIEYLPVIFPGYSFHNNNPSDTSHPLNQIPRLGGQFFWNQVSSTVTAAGANMLYVAMFDEVDEATAVFKVTNNPPRPGGVDMFVTYEGLPSDEYLWLTGKAGQGLRGEITVTRTRPAR